MQVEAVSVRLPRRHEGQRLLHGLAEPAKVTVAVIGRRWGKTFAALWWQVRRGLRGPHGDHAWVGPTYKITRVAWDEMHKPWPNLAGGSSVGWVDAIARRGERLDENQSEHWIRLVCGCRLWFLSSDNPDSLRARGYLDAVLDEGARISREAYEDAFLPTLADSDGPRLIITTPRGRRGWVYEEFMRAENNEPGYARLKRPSTDNPNPSIAAFVDKCRHTMNPNGFAQEFLAEFTEDASALFPGIDACLGGSPEAPQPTMQYVVGADLGKASSWTVLQVLRLSAGPPYQLVCEDRFPRMDWPDQVRRAKALCDRYNRAPLVFDATGVGDAVASMIRRAGITARGVKITGGGQPTGRSDTVRRSDLLDGLTVAISENLIRIPQSLGGRNQPLREELDDFTIDLDEEGGTDYVCRGGSGDRVFALAFAVHALPKNMGRPGVSSGKVTAQDIEDEDGEPSILDREF